jgi:hypothetical protein
LEDQGTSRLRQLSTCLRTFWDLLERSRKNLPKHWIGCVPPRRLSSWLRSIQSELSTRVLGAEIEAVAPGLG